MQLLFGISLRVGADRRGCHLRCGHHNDAVAPSLAQQVVSSFCNWRFRNYLVNVSGQPDINFIAVSGTLWTFSGFTISLKLQMMFGVDKT
jgi:hypothetical protein